MNRTATSIAALLLASCTGDDGIRDRAARFAVEPGPTVPLASVDPEANVTGLGWGDLEGEVRVADVVAEGESSPAPTDVLLSALRQTLASAGLLFEPSLFRRDEPRYVLGMNVEGSRSPEDGSASFAAKYILLSGRGEVLWSEIMETRGEGPEEAVRENLRRMLALLRDRGGTDLGRAVSSN